MSACLLTEESLTLFHNGTIYKARASDENWDEIRDAVREQDYDKVVELVDRLEQMRNYVTGKVTVGEDNIYYGERPIDPVLARYVLKIKRDGFKFDYMLRFIENLYANPSPRAHEQTFRFMTSNDITITDDGCMMLYKLVRDDYKDVYSGTISNHIGAVVEVPRRSVDDDPTRTCSYGLHVASLAYLRHYSGTHLMAVKVNPRDIVSVPTDYEDSKMRVCRYEVVEELPFSLISENREAWNTSVVGADENEGEEIEQWWMLRSTNPSGNFTYYSEYGEWEESPDCIQYYDSKDEAEAVRQKMMNPEWVETVEVEDRG